MRIPQAKCFINNEGNKCIAVQWKVPQPIPPDAEILMCYFTEDQWEIFIKADGTEQEGIKT
jgi:hypothetical protein